ncbi:MAG TPA: type II secretion system F family protein [Gemmatimonadaceae bacterium]|nr:type II secretion system F family protein [Gemmatimonadaceae bacterium]
MNAIILTLVFGVTLLLIVAGYAFVNRRRLAASDALRARLGVATAAAAPQATVSILKEERASQLEVLNRLLEGKGVTTTLADQIERAGSSMTVGALILTVVLCAAIGGLIGSRISALAAPLCAALGAALPFLNLKRLQAKRLKAFEAQLPDAIDMLVNAMKSGYSLQAAMKFIGEEMTAPLGPEFTRFYDEQRLGMDVRLALLNMQQRVDSLDVKMFVTALLIQRETGGNLAEIMTNLSRLMRERQALRGEIDTLTAEPKLSAVVLTLLPIALFLMVNVMNRDYMSPLYVTESGRSMLIYAVVSVIIGYFVMKKIGQVDI